jgi:hypothetical protein
VRLDLVAQIRDRPPSTTNSEPCTNDDSSEVGQGSWGCLPYLPSSESSTVAMKLRRPRHHADGVASFRAHMRVVDHANSRHEDTSGIALVRSSSIPPHLASPLAHLELSNEPDYIKGSTVLRIFCIVLPRYREESYAESRETILQKSALYSHRGESRSHRPGLGTCWSGEENPSRTICNLHPAS